MFDFCVRHLRFSENEAYRRLACARLVAKFPMMLEPLRVGATSLTNLVLLRDLFTTDNVDALLEEIAWKAKKEVEVIVARLKPRPDVPDSIALLTVQAPLVAPPIPAGASAVGPALSPPRGALENATTRPLSEDRFAFSFTGSGTFLEKLEKAGGLTHHRPVGDGLAAIFELALDALIASREKRKLGKTDRPRNAKPSKDSGDRRCTLVAPAPVACCLRRAAAKRCDRPSIQTVRLVLTACLHTERRAAWRAALRSTSMAPCLGKVLAEGAPNERYVRPSSRAEARRGARFDTYTKCRDARGVPRFVRPRRHLARV